MNKNIFVISSSPRKGGNSATLAARFATGADDEAETVEGTVKAIQGWVDCFDHCEPADTIFAGDVNNIGDIHGHAAPDRAYKVGKEV